MIARLLIATGMLAASGACAAAGAAIQLLEADVNLADKPSLQRGAKVFVNYCMGCHSLQYMRYVRMAADLGLSEEQVAGNLLFGADKIGEPMGVAMQREDAERWFGVPPPDLSVIARSRGPDWIYSYLVTFYQDSDPSRPYGVNNVVFEGAGMPHVLWAMQGHQALVKEEVAGNVVSETVTALGTASDEILVRRAVTLDDGQTRHVTDRLQVSIPGSMQPGQFRSAVRDLVNFLAYAAEPAQLARYSIGFWVVLFLLVLLVLTRMLYKEYWKDVH